MEITKDELKLMLEEQINAYEKMMEENMDKMAHFQGRIADLKEVNKSYLGKIKELSVKLKALK